MMKVQLQYEVTDKTERASFWKEIDMPSAPTRQIVFDDNDFTFEPNRSIIYSIDSQTYFVRTVTDISGTADTMDGFKKMMVKLGWKMS